jgi:peptidyl-tRNA hydrolase, PTH2 family
MDYENEIVQYIVVRKDLAMSHGKMAAQVAHASNASFYPYMEDDDVKQWLAGAFTKVILSINGLHDIKKLIEVLKNNSIIHAVIRDNCKTELQPEYNGTTLTCLAIKPYPKGLVHPLIKRLQLYKD